ncbi:hypothetical protein [Hyphomonas sp.]|jgi:hypothetical protein|uniref:hypothetical protein n=1 Tax=Hyphomonas sp. TaxID=87 RepID=UPI00260519FD|nr:hypothetical protein [Hyphomonas sp.]MDF1807793.1 hypothetical protein [Hyphomonas sp.]
MAKHLRDTDIAEIVNIIDGMRTVTWDSVIEEIALRLGRRYTRQALSRHVRIKQAFSGKKRSPRDGSVPKKTAGNKSDEVLLLLARVEKLEATIERLNNENTALLEQFVRWSYNAHAAGVPLERLDAALPATDLDRSD